MDMKENGTTCLADGQETGGNKNATKFELERALPFTLQAV
jgi:hypothetical protein